MRAIQAALHAPCSVVWKRFASRFGRFVTFEREVELYFLTEVDEIASWIKSLARCCRTGVDKRRCRCLRLADRLIAISDCSRVHTVEHLEVSKPYDLLV